MKTHLTINSNSSRKHAFALLPLLFLILLLLLFPACANKNGAAKSQASAGREIYLNNCSPCHGKKGEGKQGIAPNLANNDFIRESKLEDIKNVIRHGRSGENKRYKDIPGNMPQWSHKLSEEEINEVAVYLKEELN